MSTLAEQNASTTEKVDGYTPAQRFFLGFGQVWCETHLQNRLRVFGRRQIPTRWPLAYQWCRAGTPMSSARPSAARLANR